MKYYTTLQWKYIHSQLSARRNKENEHNVLEFIKSTLLKETHERCLLPAAVYVIDLVVFVEGYGLKAVCQRAIQDSDA